MTDDRPPLKEVDHTHPNATETVTEMYRRGPSVPDGGGDADDAPETTIGDVDHVAPDDLSPNDVFERGQEDDEVDTTDATDGDDTTGDVDRTVEAER